MEAVHTVGVEEGETCRNHREKNEGVRPLQRVCGLWLDKFSVTTNLFLEISLILSRCGFPLGLCVLFRSLLAASPFGPLVRSPHHPSMPPIEDL